MFSSMDELEHATERVALTVCTTQLYSREFSKRYRAGRAPCPRTLDKAIKESMPDLRIEECEAQNRTRFRRLIALEVVRKEGFTGSSCTFYQPVNPGAVLFLIENTAKPTGAESPLGGGHRRSAQMIELGMKGCLVDKEVFDYLQANTPKFEESKPMKVLRPTLVNFGGNDIDIDTANKDMLVNIIREANKQLEADKDMIALSAVFRAQAEDIKEVIKLCIAQIDKASK